MGLPEETLEHMSVGQRITGVLYNDPRGTFTDIGRHSGWLPPLAIICTVSILSTAAILPRLQEYIKHALELQAQAAPEMANAAASGIAIKAAIGGTLVGSLLSPIIMCLLLAGLLKLCNIFAGEPTPYRQFFAVTVYSYFPILIAGIIASIMIFISPAEHMEEVSTSLYLLFPPGSKGFAANLARQIDPFYLWSLALMALGSSVISRARFRSYAIFVGLLWAIFAVGYAFLTPGI